MGSIPSKYGPEYGRMDTRTPVERDTHDSGKKRRKRRKRRRKRKKKRKKKKKKKKRKNKRKKKKNKKFCTHKTDPGGIRTLNLLIGV